MYRRQHVNIPIEIVRTVVAISETGSLSKAGERLGLSQPAISSQVKRLQNLVGGALFVKTANGTTTTELGKLAPLCQRLCACRAWHRRNRKGDPRYLGKRCASLEARGSA